MMMVGRQKMGALLWLLLLFIQSSLAQKSCSLKTCVNLCCPEGEVFKFEEKAHRCELEYERKRKCLKHPDYQKLDWTPKIWKDGNILEVQKGVDFQLVYKNTRETRKERFFPCPKEKQGERWSMLPVQGLFPSPETRIQEDGSLQVHFEDYKSGDHQVQEYSQSDFCTTFRSADFEYDDYDYENGTSDYGQLPEKDYEQLLDAEKSVAVLHPQLYVCESVEHPATEKFKDIFYPAAIFLSCFFILLTLVVFLLLRDLRKNLFGKITLGFLVNVFLCYFVLGLRYSVEHKLDHMSGFCIFLGYSSQHTFISFFFWMSSMAMNMAYKFSDIFKEESKEHGRTLVAITAYSQGVPLLVTIATAAMDNFGSCGSTLPNIGRYSCFLGNDPELFEEIGFFASSEFLYFYVFILLIIIVNSICFFITGYFLIGHWTEVKTIRSNSSGDTKWNHVLIVAKIFLIMGLTWTLELISTAMDYSNPDQTQEEVRIVLDILNLLSGVTIFAVLVCKESVWKKLKLRIGKSSNENQARRANVSELTETTAIR